MSGATAGELPPPSIEAAEGPTGFWGNTAWVYRRVKLHCRTSAVGKFLTNAVRPVSKLTGGLIPTPNDNHFAAAVELHATKPAGMAPGATPKPPPPPPPGVAVAAVVKAEKAQAKIRREAVAYLAGLDCRYYPEAEAALIASLRADRDQCVRLEAAKALGCGCCCTPATVKALTICVTGSEADGNPAERSSAVRRAALYALQKCERCGATSAPDAVSPEPPLGTAEQDGAATLVAFHASEAEAPHQDGPIAPALPSAPARDALKEEASGASLLDLWRAAER